MPRKLQKPIVKITTRIFEEDLEEIKKYATPERKTQEIIRDIIHQYVVHAGARLRAKIDQLENEDLA